MGTKVPWKDIPDSSIVPEDVYALRVKSIEETTTKEKPGKKAKLMYVAQLCIEEPKPYKGLVLFDRFTVGTEDDPQANDPETWKASIGAKRMKQLFKALQIDLGDDMDDTIENAESQRCLAGVKLDPAHDDVATGKHYGESNSIGTYYAIGAPGITVGGGKKTQSKPAAPAKPKAPPLEDDDDEDEEDDAPAEKPAPAKAAPESTGGKPKKLKKAENVECPICSEDTPRAEFLKHMQAHDE